MLATSSQPGGAPFHVEDRHGVLVVELDRETFSRVDVEEIARHLHARIEAIACPKLVLDFRHVHFLSSGMVGKIVSLHFQICKKAGELRLCGMRASALEIFQLTRLDKALHIDATVEESLARMG